MQENGCSSLKKKRIENVNKVTPMKKKTYKYSRTPEIETAYLSQSHAGLNLSQFQTDCSLRINSSTAILSYLKLFGSILGLATTLKNEKYWYFTLLRTFINWYVMHSLFFINDECIT